MKPYLITVAILMSVAVPLTGFAELPGMPAAAPADEARTENHAPPPTGPQRGSLFGRGVAAATPGPNGEAPQQAVNFMAVPSAQSKRYHKNDIITVVIQENSDSVTNGKGSSNKTQDFDLALQQFVQLAVAQSGLPTVETVANPSKLPEVKFKYNNNTSSDADQERTDSLSARVTGTIVDIKPNGTLVVEAVKNITVDAEVQVFKLSGICRVEDIAADNTILSTQMAELSLSKQTKGDVRDGTKRGWLNQFIDKVSPF